MIIAIFNLKSGKVFSRKFFLWIYSKEEKKGSCKKLIGLMHELFNQLRIKWNYGQEMTIVKENSLTILSSYF